MGSDCISSWSLLIFLLFVYVEFSGLWEVEVFGPGVAILADKLYWSVTASTLLAAIMNVIAGDVL